jgi:hypothetical protein
MTTSLKVDLENGNLEVRGSEEFVKKMYEDFKQQVSLSNGQQQGTTSSGRNGQQFYFQVGQEEFNGKNATDLYVRAMDTLASQDPSFIKPLQNSKPKRCIIAKDKKSLFPDHQEYAEQFARKLNSGYWLDVMNTTKQKFKILSKVAETLGKKPSEDYQLQMGEHKV